MKTKYIKVEHLLIVECEEANDAYLDDVIQELEINATLHGAFVADQKLVHYEEISRKEYSDHHQ